MKLVQIHLHVLRAADAKVVPDAKAKALLDFVENTYHRLALMKR